MAITLKDIRPDLKPQGVIKTIADLERAIEETLNARCYETPMPLRILGAQYGRTAKRLDTSVYDVATKLHNAERIYLWESPVSARTAFTIAAARFMLDQAHQLNPSDDGKAYMMFTSALDRLSAEGALRYTRKGRIAPAQVAPPTAAPVELPPVEVDEPTTEADCIPSNLAFSVTE